MIRGTLKIISKNRRQVFKMGWTGIYMIDHTSRKACLDDEWSRNFKVLKSSMVNTTYYGALFDPRNNETFAIVCLTSVDGMELCYKDMTEHSLPYYFDCPKSILNLLTPTTDENANEWRKTCWEKHDKKSKAPKAKIGDTIKFDTPISFQGGEKLDTFTLTKYGTQTVFEHNGRLYKIRKWRQKSYKVLQNA